MQHLKLNIIGIMFLLLGLSKNLAAQNTIALWKSTCNCGVAEMIIQDDNQNSFVITDGSVGTPRVLKLSKSGQLKLNQSYLPQGYLYMRYTNSFYKSGFVYLAGYADSFPLSNRMFLMKIDTSGTLINQVVIDSVAAYRLSGIKSAPFYNYGFYLDQQNNIHVGYTKADPNFFYTYSLLKLDLNFNLISHFEELLSFSASAGPFYVNKNGSVYYSITSAFNKLNSNYTSIDWSYPLANYANANMITEDTSGNPVFIKYEAGAVPAPVTTVVRLIDNGLNYTLSYENTLNAGTKDLDLIIADTVENTFYVGGNDNSTNPYSRFVSKHDILSGAEIWSDSAQDGQAIFDMEFDLNGKLVTSGGGTDYHLWFYNNLGVVTGSIVYDGPCGANDAVAAFTFSDDNRIIVTGSACENSNNTSYATTLKYINPNTTTSLTETVIDVHQIFIYPNPASDRIYFSANVYVSAMELTDATGRVIQITLEKDQSFSVSTLASGIYFLRILNANGNLIVKKIIKE